MGFQYASLACKPVAVLPAGPSGMDAAPAVCLAGLSGFPTSTCLLPRVRHWPLAVLPAAPCLSPCSCSSPLPLPCCCKSHRCRDSMWSIAGICLQTRKIVSDDAVKNLEAAAKDLLAGPRKTLASCQATLENCQDNLQVRLSRQLLACWAVKVKPLTRLRRKVPAESPACCNRLGLAWLLGSGARLMFLLVAPASLVVSNGAGHPQLPQHAWPSSRFTCQLLEHQPKLLLALLACLSLDAVCRC